MIQVESLVKMYGTFEAVKGIDLNIPKGEIFGLLGPNGAGKTSTISIISGLHRPTSGAVRVNGLDTQAQARQVRQQVGVVPQELALYTTLTAWDNLDFFGAVYGLSGRPLRQRIAEVLEVVGLADRSRDVVATYSGGMKRRLNLACGLLHSPAVLLLDEPTVGVDPQSRNLIFERIRQINRETGMTIVYTTHYMEEAQTLCGRVAIMDHGRVVAEDTPQALIRRFGTGVIAVKTAAAPERVSEAVKVLARANEATWSEGVITVRAAEACHAVVDVLAQLQARGIEPQSLQVADASLESVFLKLTGKSLRDPGSAPVEGDLQP